MHREPTTPTGRRLWDHPDVRADYVDGITGDDILAIEDEAYEQAWERLTTTHCCQCWPQDCYTSDSYATPCEEYHICSKHGEGG